MRFNPDEYITVSERIEKFYAKFPQGRIHHHHHRAQRRDRLHPHPRRGLPRARRRAPRRHGPRLRASQRRPRAGGQLRRGLRDFSRSAARSRSSASRSGAAWRAARRSSAGRRSSRPRPPRPRRPQRPARADARAAGRESAPPRPPRPPTRGADLDAQILQAAEELGYDAAKVRKWVNQKYEVTGGLGSLTPHDKREVLEIFTEQAPPAAQPRAGQLTGRGPRT